MIEGRLSTLVQPCCMSWLLQRHGSVSDFCPSGLGSIPSRDIGDKHFSPVTIAFEKKLNSQIFVTM